MTRMQNNYLLSVTLNPFNWNMRQGFMAFVTEKTHTNISKMLNNLCFFYPCWPDLDLEHSTAMLGEN